MTLPTATVEAAVSRYEKPLLRYARRWVHDPELARDVVQDTFLRYYEAGSEEESDARTKAWLYTVCRNRAIDIRRHIQRAPKLDDGTAKWAEPLGEKQCDLSNVCDELETLAPQKSNVMLLRYRDGLSYRGIAEATGLTVGNVGFTISTTLKRIRMRLAVTTILLLLAAAAFALMREPVVVSKPVFDPPRSPAPLVATAAPAPPVPLEQQQAEAPSAKPQKRRRPPRRAPKTKLKPTFRPMGL